jgi:aminocarboxymuconate-semialdehyde decarboxylase
LVTARPVVDAHSHFTPRAVIGRLQRSAGLFPHVALRDLGVGKFSFDFPDIPPTRPMQPRLWDISAALEWLDRQGIDVHVTGAWADVFGYTLPADEAAAWCRLINEETLGELNGAQRVLPLATVPIQSGRHAVQELEAAHAMGFRGVPNAIGRVNDTPIAVSRLLYAGVLTRHPDLQMIARTAAAACPTRWAG